MNFLSYFNVFNKKQDNQDVQEADTVLEQTQHKKSVDYLEVPDDTSEGICAKGVKRMMENEPPSPGKKSSMKMNKGAVSGNLPKSKNLIMEARRPSISDPNEIFNKIIGNSKKTVDSVCAAKQKREAIMVPQANPNIDEWDEEMAEIHKYVENREDVLYSESYY